MPSRPLASNRPDLTGPSRPYGLPSPRGPYCPERAGAVSRLKRLIQEIHRRSLWQVLGIYLVGAWVAFQGIEALLSRPGLPEWVPRLAAAILTHSA